MSRFGPGAANPRWRGADRMLSEHGYVKIRVGEGHPLADPYGFAYEHHLVWIAAGNPPLRDDQTLHHHSGDKTDNRIENLCIMTSSDHARLHAATMPRVNGRFVRREAVPA